MKRFIALVACFVLLSVGSIASAQATKLLNRSAAIHDPGGAGNVVDSTDYYGSGNDDAFAEFGVATFSFDTSDFGGSAISALSLFEYTLTHNDRGFSDGTEFELFLTTDDFDATYSTLSYDTSLVNGLDVSQFTNLSSLGVFAYAPTEGGTQEVLNITLSSAQEADLVAEINAGSEFSILIVATATDADVTFTGFDDGFEPEGQPVLALDSSAAGPLLGDINGDGVVNFLDISPFIAVLSVGGIQAEADINGDGAVNFLDISPFIGLLGS